MKCIGMVLLVGVFLRHHAIYWLAGVTNFTPAAMFYMLGGVWEVLLCGVLLTLALTAKPGPWRAAWIAAMIIGILEGVQVTGCRMLVTDIKAVPAGTNLCDFVVGAPVGAVMMSLYIIAICWSLTRK